MFELMQNVISFCGSNTAMKDEWVEMIELLTDPVQAFGPLAEHDGLSTAGDNLFQLDRETVQLAALPGEGIEVGNLLQS